MNHLTGDVRKIEISIHTSVRVTRESQFSTLSCFFTHKYKSKVPYFPTIRTVPPSIDLHSIYHPMQFDIKAFHVRHKPQFPPAVIHSSIDISRVTNYFRGKPKDLSKIFHCYYLSIDNPNLVTLSQWTETFLKLLTPPSFRNRSRSSSFLLLPTLFFARFVVVVVVVLPLSDSHPPRQRHSRQVALISSSSASGRLTTIGYIR